MRHPLIDALSLNPNHLVSMTEPVKFELSQYIVSKLFERELTHLNQFLSLVLQLDFKLAMAHAQMYYG